MSLSILIGIFVFNWWSLAVEEVDGLVWFDRWREIEVYLFVTALSLVGLCVVPFLRRSFVRVPLALLLLMGIGVDRIMIAISGSPLTLDMATIAIRETGMSDGFFRTFGGVVAINLVLVAVISLPILLRPAGPFHLPSWLGLFPVTALAGVALVIYDSRGEIGAFPSPISVPAQFLVSQFLVPTNENLQRPAVAYAGPFHPKIKKIVMVVDESVRGNVLGINNPELDNTPHLSNASEILANFGVAISGANCSADSRAMMRFGLQPRNLPDVDQVWTRIPTLWQYVKAAGFKSVFLDAWYRFGTFHSYMTNQEALEVDEYKTVLGHPYYNRDMDVASELVELLKRDEPMLIYVNKYGTHMPYTDSFPPDLDYVAPEPAAAPYLTGTRRESVRNYRKALRWSVDEFFATILPAIDDETVLIYTSDHGEALYEGNAEWGHCSEVEPALSEAYVPLFVASRQPDLLREFQGEAKRAYGRASHFEIFPTLLELMGYPSAWVDEHYGPSLLDVPADRKRAFLLGPLYLGSSQWVPDDPSAARHGDEPQTGAPAPLSQ